MADDLPRLETLRLETLRLATLPAVTALLQRLRAAASPAAAIACFEAALPGLPAFSGAAPMVEAAAAYDAAGQAHAANLMRGLAAQLQPPADAPAPPQDATAAAVLADRLPNERLLHRVRQGDGHDDTGVAALFEAVLPLLPPLDEYWVYYHLAAIYERLGRDDAAFLLSAVAIQMEPQADCSEWPMRRVLARLVDREAWPQAAALRAAWLAANPSRLVLDGTRRARLTRHAPAGIRWQAKGRRDRPLLPAEERAPAQLRTAGRAMPHALQPLLQAETRPAITLAELADAEVLVLDGSVSVWAADGTPQPDLSVGASAGLVRFQLQQREARGERIAHDTLDAAVLIGDQFPAPNLCHFLLDHATRLKLYARAGLALSEHVVLGPDLATPFQHEIARRMGARRYMGLRGCARLRLGRLAVTSNCHHLRHTAHLGASWALDAVRNGFADVTAGIKPHRRLFLSRADAASRRMVDEDALYALLQRHGYERIVPGALPLVQQVQAFAAASHVVGPHGAALANIAFCAPGTRVLEIFHPHYGTYAYAMLAAPLGLDYAAMVGFDGASDAEDDNDPGLATLHRRRGSERDVRADMPSLQAWLEQG